MNNKLYVEFKVRFPTNTSQELLHELSEEVQKLMYDFYTLAGNKEYIVAPDSVEFELVMEIAKENK